MLHFKTIWNIYKNKIAVAKNMLILTINIFLLSIHHAKNICVLNTLLLYTNGVVSIPHSISSFKLPWWFYLFGADAALYILSLLCVVLLFFYWGATHNGISPWAPLAQMRADFDYIDEYMYVCGYNFENKIFIHKIYKQLLKINYKNRCQKNYYFLYKIKIIIFIYFVKKNTRTTKRSSIHDTSEKIPVIFCDVFVCLFQHSILISLFTIQWN